MANFLWDGLANIFYKDSSLLENFNINVVII